MRMRWISSALLIFEAPQSSLALFSHLLISRRQRINQPKLHLISANATSGHKAPSKTSQKRSNLGRRRLPKGLVALLALLRWFIFLAKELPQTGEIDAAKANWLKASKLLPTAATGHPAQPSGNASAQQAADLLKLIDYRSRKCEPGKFAFVQMPHIQQGYNNCGSTACATFARFQGSKIGGWDFKRLCPSPLGTGTDWGHLLDASKKIGQKWKLITFTPDDLGFDQATAFLKTELDAGRPVVVDFKYIGPQFPNGSAGHTLNVCGYIAKENLYILCNPAVATPGLQLITAADLKHFWRSDHYGAISKGVLSRPAFVMETAR